MERPAITFAVMTPSLSMPGYVEGLNILGHTVRDRCSLSGRPANRSRSHRSVIGAANGCSSR